MITKNFKGKNYTFKDEQEVEEWEKANDIHKIELTFLVRGKENYEEFMLLIDKLKPENLNETRE